MNAVDLRDAFHYMYRDEVPALQILARQIKREYPVAVNIGAGAGTSGLALLEARPDLFLVTIDIQQESSPFGCLEAEEKVLREAGLWGPRNKQIHGNSIEVGKNWPNYFSKNVDFLFIDGDHSYEGCQGDIQTWLEWMNDGGIVAVHDYAKDLILPTPDGPHPMPWPGVDKAVHHFLLGVYDCIMYVDSLIAFRV